MRQLEAGRYVLCLALGVALGACSLSPIDLDRKIDYKSATKERLPPLDVPPDLTRPGSDDRYSVPDLNPRGTATYSEYDRERQGQRTSPANPKLLPQLENARIERDAGQRWLVVKGAPEQVWPVVKNFWQEAGFIVNLEIPEAGVMETDWAENRAKLDFGAVRNFLSRILDSVYSTSERDKFRTRLERGVEPGTTEIYVSHRGMEEVYTSTPSADRAYTAWQPRPSDSSLEAEMLGRIMVRFGVDDSRVKAQLAAGPTVAPRAVLSKEANGAGTLALTDQFDRAWRRVGLALDRVGFTVEDRDRSKGLYFVRYIDPRIDSASPDQGGFFSKLFGGSEKPRPEQFRIQVKGVDSTGSEVAVLAKDGAHENSETARRILSVLYEQLK